ncbi:MAG: hypothetical protein V7700_16705, partial [Halioglobus sp.]
DIELGLPLSLQPNVAESATLTVAGRAIILSHPRVDQQSMFEQRVLQEFCSRQDCQSLTAPANSLQPIPVSAAQVAPQWLFNGSGPVCSHDGIELMFANTSNLSRYRSLCEQLLQEASRLATEIAWQQRHGVAVNWDTLVVQAIPGRPEHQVLVNNAGDSILVTIPLLYSNADLLERLRPWLQSRFAGEEVPATVKLDAADYGWE